MAKVDWTGVSPVDEPIAPLTEETFVSRLALLSTRARDIQVLRDALRQQLEKKSNPDT